MGTSPALLDGHPKYELRPSPRLDRRLATRRSRFDALLGDSAKARRPDRVAVARTHASRARGKRMPATCAVESRRRFAHAFHGTVTGYARGALTAALDGDGADRRRPSAATRRSRGARGPLSTRAGELSHSLCPRWQRRRRLRRERGARRL